MSRAARPATVTIEAVDEHGERVATDIAGEHPLTLYVDRHEIVTLMTLGQAPEALAIGYLRNQRLIDSIDQIQSVQVDWECSAAAVSTRDGIDGLARRTARRTVTTGCGQGTVFGDLMAEIDGTRIHHDGLLGEATLQALLEAVRRHQSIYKRAGAVHGCALARNGSAEIVYFVEDVGRHNAVDAIAGQMWLDGISGHDSVFYTTGRLTSEMVIKTAQMGIPFLVSRSGLTQMGYDIAQRVGLTMVGRAQGSHYLVFTGGERFVRAGTAAGP